MATGRSVGVVVARWPNLLDAITPYRLYIPSSIEVQVGHKLSAADTAEGSAPPTEIAHQVLIPEGPIIT